MKEYINYSTGEVLGVEYTPDEKDTAMAAIELYESQLLAGRVSSDPTVVRQAIDINKALRKELNDDLDVMNSKIHAIISGLQLSYVARMHEGLGQDLYEPVCKMLEIEPEYLATHAIAARRLIERQDAEQILLD